MHNIDTETILKKMQGFSHDITMGNLFMAYPDLAPGPQRQYLADTMKALVVKELIEVIEPEAGPDLYRITQAGRDYLNRAEISEREAEEERRLSLQKLRYETVTAKWILKTYWWTFCFAIAGVVLAIIALFK